MKFYNLFQYFFLKKIKVQLKTLKKKYKFFSKVNKQK